MKLLPITLLLFVALLTTTPTQGTNVILPQTNISSSISINDDGVIYGENDDFILATTEENYISISWSTLSETNNAYFSVERSTDQTNWLTVGTVDGAQSSTSSIVYNIIDTEATIDDNTHYYYRLKQTCIGGQTSYSKTNSIDTAAEEPADIAIYPNPATTTLLIDIYISGANQNDVALISSSLTDVTNLVTITPVDSDTVEVDVSNLSLGTYYIKIRNRIYTIRIV